MHPSCPDFDLCAGCEALPIPQHPGNHPLLKMRTSETVIPTVYRVGQTTLLDASVSPTHHKPAPPVSRPISKESECLHNPSTRIITNPSPCKSPSVCNAESLSLKSSLSGHFSPTLKLESLHTTRCDESQTNPSTRISTKGSPTIPTALVESNRSSPILVSFPSPSNSLPTFVPNRQSLPQSSVGPEMSSDILITDDSEAQPHDQIPATLPAVGSVKEARTMASNTSPNDLVSWSDLPQAWNNLARTSWNTAGVENYIKDLSFTEETSLIQPTVSETSTQGSPLDAEALLNRSPISDSHEIGSVGDQLATSTTRSLSALLDAYRTISPGKSQQTSIDLEKVTLSASFVQSMTVPDGQKFAPGVTFVKCWRLLNNGTRVWPAATEVVYVGGASFAIHTLASHVGALRPGEWRDVWTTELKVGLLCTK